MKILLLVTGLRVGGAERQVVTLADEFARQGHEVMVVVLTGQAEVRPQNPQVLLVELNANKNIFSLAVAYVRTVKLIRNFVPDVVHSHMVHANIFARLLRLVCPIKRLICSAHSTHEGGRLRVLAYRATHFLADLTTNVSRAAAQSFEAQGAAPPGKMRVVSNGVDTQVFRRDDAARENVRRREEIPREQKVMLAVGRLTAAKDYPLLLAAYARTLAVRPDTSLWIVGGGELDAVLKSLATELDIASRVRFWGLRDDVADLMNAADVFALSSAWEGFSLVIAEAMACEKVVVSTRVGGVGEVLGDCGLLVEPGDRDALAAALVHALEMSEAQAQIMGRQARARVVSKFSLESTARKWLEIYASRTAGLRHGI